MAEFPAPREGIVLTHFIVAADVERSRRFYADVLGGEVVRDGGAARVLAAITLVLVFASATVVGLDHARADPLRAQRRRVPGRLGALGDEGQGGACQHGQAA